MLLWLATAPLLVGNSGLHSMNGVDTLPLAVVALTAISSIIPLDMDMPCALEVSLN